MSCPWLRFEKSYLKGPLAHVMLALTLFESLSRSFVAQSCRPTSDVRRCS